MSSRAPRPQLVDGLTEPRLTDVPRLLWWGQRGYWHGATHGPTQGRVVSAFFALAWWPSWPLLLVGQTIVVKRSAARYYLSPDRDAVLAIVATRDGWHVEDHLSARPGEKRGKALRALVLPALRAQADAAGVAIYTTAASEKLAKDYAAELPGLVDVGAGRLRGRRMRREPGAATADWSSTAP